MATTTNNNKDLEPEEKVEQEIRQAVPDDLGFGWFKWHFMVYPALFAFTFGVVVLNDLIYVLGFIIYVVDFIISIAVLPFAMVYSVLTGKWIEEEDEETNKTQEVTSTKVNSKYMVDDSVDVIEDFNSLPDKSEAKHDKEYNIDEIYDDESDDDEFVEIEIK